MSLKETQTVSEISVRGASLWHSF